MKIATLMTLLMCTGQLIAHTQLRVWADEMSYKDKELELEGHIAIDLPQAFIMADRARLCPEENSQQRWQRLQITDEVRIRLSRGEMLCCSEAQFDFTTQRGEFFTNQPSKRVCYRDATGSEPLLFECVHLAVCMEEREQATRPELTALHAKGAVRCSRGDQLVVEAGELCRGQWDNCTVPKAIVNHYAECSPPQEVTQLSDHAVVRLTNFGMVHADEVIWLTRVLDGDALRLDYVRCEGQSIWELQFEVEQIHRLHCPGLVTIDETAKCATFEGVTDQLHYTDGTNEFIADRLILAYTNAEKYFHPTSIVLEGSVRLKTNRNVSDNLQIQYALADRATYDPVREEILLTGDGGKRVLLMESDEQTRVSAEALVINRTNHRIQGVGHVQFNLNEQEAASLQEAFALP